MKTPGRITQVTAGQVRLDPGEAVRFSALRRQMRFPTGVLPRMERDLSLPKTPKGTIVAR